MKKYFKFTNNHSDVTVVGNSQLTGFTGRNKNQDTGMNIAMCSGARIEDCLTECQRYRYKNMKNKVYLFYLKTNLDNKILIIKLEHHT